jgi:hypothetical protein
MRLRPKNWLEFQHYKDRSPPWIKLHRKLLDDRAFNSLPLASMALAPFLWLLASESKDGWFEGGHEELAFRLRWKVKDIEVGLNALIASGFFEVEHNASAPLAEGLQLATPETERETQVQREREREIPARKRASKPLLVEHESFTAFWDAYPDSRARLDAVKAYGQALTRAAPEEILAGARRYAVEVRGEPKKFIKVAGGWLRDERWRDGESANVIPITAFNSPEEIEGQRLAKERLYGKTGN